VAEWTEDDSRTYRDIAPVAVPRREEQVATLLSLIPCTPDDACRIVEIGCGDGRLSAALLELFPRVSIVASDPALGGLCRQDSGPSKFSNMSADRQLVREQAVWRRN